MKKEINVQVGESVLDAIRREDTGEFPILNFPVIKISLHGDYSTTRPLTVEDDPGLVTVNAFGEVVENHILASVAQSIRRGDHPEVELGVSTGSVGGEYQALANMEMVEIFFGAHVDDWSSRIRIWNTDKGKVCGVDAFSHDVSLGNEEWSVWTTMRQSHDLSRCLETTASMVRKSDHLQLPCTMKGGVISLRHTKNAVHRAEAVSRNRKVAGELMDEQIQLMDQFSKVGMDWATFQKLLLSKLPEFDPARVGDGAGKSRRENTLSLIRKHCGAASTVLECLLGFTKFLAEESSSRTCKGKDQEEVRYLSMNTGGKFRKLQTVQKAVLDYIMDIKIELEDIPVEEESVPA